MAAGSKICAVTQASIVETVFEQVRCVAPPDLVGDLTLDTPLLEVGLDSLAQMDVVNRIETRYGVRFAEESLYDLETCRDLVLLIEDTLARANGQVPAEGGWPNELWKQAWRGRRPRSTRPMRGMCPVFPSACDFDSGWWIPPLLVCRIRSSGSTRECAVQRPPSQDARWSIHQLRLFGDGPASASGKCRQGSD